MRMEEAFYNIYMYLYNRNVLEYAQIARSGPKSMIRDIESLSNMYCTMYKPFLAKIKMELSKPLWENW